MNRKFLVLVCFLVYCSDSSSIRAGEKLSISSGGAVRADGAVRVIGIGAQLVGVRRTNGKAIAGPRKATPAAVKAATTGISSEFILGEVYVYPNPAKGGHVPTFHVEVGVADSVKITIYTVSGDVAHTYTATGMPSIINDGHGPEYAYEYAWRGHIPSGVYYYAIEAQKAGKKLRKTGKFAVVR